MNKAEIVKHEQVVLDGFTNDVAPHLTAIDKARLVGQYPQTMLEVTASQNGQTRKQEWSLWDGKIVGCPPGQTSSAEDYLTLVGAEIDEWLSAPYWRRSQQL